MGNDLPCPKALVIFGTRWGGTIPIAQKIGETLKDEGYQPTIANAKENLPEVEPYDLVIVGSSISMGTWTKETKKFIQKNAAKLKHKKFACFVSCGMVLRQEGHEKALHDYLTNVAKGTGLNPISCGVFGGLLDFKKSHGFLGNFFVNSSKKKLKEMGVDTTKPYDFRNWDEIKSWTKELTKI
jgi:menaquinone-dependent protoporphyrinogen oxidase